MRLGHDEIRAYRLIDGLIAESLVTADGDQLRLG